MISLSVQQFGTEALAARFKDEVRAFQKEQRKQMLLAGNVVKADVVSKVRENFPTDTKKHSGGGSTPLGPLRNKIGVRIFYTTGDVVALIRPKASAFYGRFQETGLDVETKGRSTGRKVAGGFLGLRKVNERGAPYHFHLPAKPFLEPVAAADEEKVVNILGDAYSVFYSGGAA
jgi:hypothetical protein